MFTSRNVLSDPPTLEELQKRLDEVNEYIKENQPREKYGIIPPHINQELLKNAENEKAKLEKEINEHPDHNKPAQPKKP